MEALLDVRVRESLAVPQLPTRPLGLPWSIPLVRA